MCDDTSDADDVPPRLGPGASDGDRSTDALVDALADSRARRVVCVLESRSANVVELDDLVDGVVEAERDEAGRASDDRDDSEDHRQRVAIDLHHRSLPKLDEAAVLDYDPRSNTVRYWCDGRVSSYLELFDCDSDF